MSRQAQLQVRNLPICLLPVTHLDVRDGACDRAHKSCRVHCGEGAVPQPRQQTSAHAAGKSLAESDRALESAASLTPRRGRG